MLQPLKTTALCFRCGLILSISSLSLLTGCVFRKLAFSNANFLLVSQIDSAFDLTSEQKTFVEQKLERFLSEMSSTEVVALRELLKEAGIQIFKKTTEQHVASFFDRWDNIQGGAVRRASLPAGEFLMKLSRDQITYFEEFSTKRNKKRVESLAEGESTFTEKRIQKVSKTFTEWLGKLNNIQINAIRDFSKGEYQRSLEEQPASQRSKLAFLQLLSSQPGKTQLGEFLAGQQSHPFGKLDPIHVKTKSDRRKAWTALITQVVAAATQTQKIHFKKETESLSLDLLLIGSDENLE